MFPKFFHSSTPIFNRSPLTFFYTSLYFPTSILIHFPVYHTFISQILNKSFFLLPYQLPYLIAPPFTPFISLSFPTYFEPTDIRRPLQHGFLKSPPFILDFPYPLSSCPFPNHPQSFPKSPFIFLIFQFPYPYPSVRLITNQTPFPTPFNLHFPYY